MSEAATELHHRRPDDDSVEKVMRALSRKFGEAGIEIPDLDARVLVERACGLAREQIVAAPDRILSVAEVETILGFGARRLAHEPVSRIVGEREFWSRSYLIGEATLDPRPETETLVEACLELCQAGEIAEEKSKLLDLGTGTGCILISLLLELPRCTGVGMDISVPALALAQLNGDRIGVADRVHWLAADWLSGIDGRFDLVISNPPYIRRGDLADLPPEVARYDPECALDGGLDGLDAYRRIAVDALGVLRTGGWLVAEIGDGQADDVRNIFASAGLDMTEGPKHLWCDLAGVERVIAGSRA